MIVVVKYAGSAAPSLAAWQMWLLARPPHDPGVYQVMIDTMTHQFQQSNGLPSGSWWCTSLHPNRYVWRFASNA